MKAALVFVTLGQAPPQGKQFAECEQYERNANFEKNEGHGWWDLTTLKQVKFHIFRALRNRLI